MQFGITGRSGLLKIICTTSNMATPTLGWQLPVRGTQRPQETRRDPAPTVMTTHGCRHVVDLLHSLDDMAENVSRSGPELELDVQEAYILLCAAHLHDVGNIGGRVGHPERAGEIISENKKLFVGTFVRQYIFDVASAHGGEDHEFGKDTIREDSVRDRESAEAPIAGSNATTRR